MSQAEIDTLNSAIAGLNAAIADGVRQVTLGGQTVTYNSTEALIRARDDAQRRLNALMARANGTPQRRRTLAYYAGRGYNDGGR